MNKHFQLIILTAILACATSTIGCGGAPKAQIGGRDGSSSSDSANPVTGNPGNGNPGNGVVGPGASDPNAPKPDNPDWEKAPISPTTGGDGKPWKDSSDPAKNDTKNRPTGTGDIDGDHVPDADDNCPYVKNADQKDTDGDNVGDACDTCPTVPNNDPDNGVGQRNDAVCGGNWGTLDSIKDANKKAQIQWIHKQKTTDTDKDGLPDFWDKCPKVVNKLLSGKTKGSHNLADYEGFGDKDGDGVPDACDNCPDAFNKYQTDKNKNGIGDVCDTQDTNELICKGTSAAEKNKYCEDKKLSHTCSTTTNRCSCGDQTADYQRLLPNIALVLDYSGSMQGKNYNDLKSAVRDLINNTYNNAQYLVYGFSYNKTDVYDCYHSGNPTSGFIGGNQFKKYTSSDKDSIINAVGSVYPCGSTPTGPALQSVKTAFSTITDPNRPKIVILMTDGSPEYRVTLIGQDAAKDAINASKELYQAGIELYVVGIGYSSSENLTACAKAGSGNKRSQFYNTTDSSSLAKVIKAIAIGSGTCDFNLNQSAYANNNTHVAWVKINGKFLVQNTDYVYDVNEHKIVLKPQQCNDFKLLKSPTVDITLGCPDGYMCQTTKLNGNKSWIDNSNQLISEAAMGPEFCNGIDDNCDGVIDDGCDDIGLSCSNPGVSGCSKGKRGDKCDKNSDCEAPMKCVENGGKKTCQQVCANIGEECGGVLKGTWVDDHGVTQTNQTIGCCGNSEGTSSLQCHDICIGG